LFCGGSFFYAFIKLRKKIYEQKSCHYYKLSTIKSFYYKEKNFATILVFLGFCHNPGKLTKEEK
jgi:hypothetical protein